MRLQMVRASGSPRLPAHTSHAPCLVWLGPMPVIDSHAPPVCPLTCTHTPVLCCMCRVVHHSTFDQGFCNNSVVTQRSIRTWTCSCKPGISGLECGINSCTDNCNGHGELAACFLRSLLPSLCRGFDKLLHSW